VSAITDGEVKARVAVIKVQAQAVWRGELADI
jgi:hypothetical protein